MSCFPPIASLEVTIGEVTRSFSLFETVISRIECAKILEGKSYPLLLGREQVRTVVDIGANIGAATVYFALHYPEARVFSFEPAPSSFALLQRNTEGLKNVSTFGIGLAERDQSAHLFVGQMDPATNSLRHSWLNSTETVEVLLREPVAVFREHDIKTIDVLKIDTEGYELPILKALGEILVRCQLIYLEYHAEEDRLAIDRLLTATHLLCSGNILGLHRGELCYIRRELLSPDQERLQIKG